jgi:hypothetical protein
MTKSLSVSERLADFTDASFLSLPQPFPTDLATRQDRSGANRDSSSRAMHALSGDSPSLFTLRVLPVARDLPVTANHVAYQKPHRSAEKDINESSAQSVLPRSGSWLLGDVSPYSDIIISWL